jgi:hypothetical protein
VVYTWLFLASDGAKFTAGAMLDIDGGLTGKFSREPPVLKSPMGSEIKVGLRMVT